MIIDKISLDQDNKIHMELFKSTKEESRLVVGKRLRKIDIKYNISQIFEPEKRVEETQAIKSIGFKNNHLLFNFPLQDLQFPDRCQISVKDLRIILTQGQKLSIPIDQTFSILELKENLSEFEPEPSSEWNRKAEIDKLIPDVNFVITELGNEQIINKFKRNSNLMKNKTGSKEELISGFEVFELMSDAKEIFNKANEQIEKVNDDDNDDDELANLKARDLEFSIREKLLTIIFLSLSYIINLRNLDSEARKLTVKLIQKYFSNYLEQN